MRLSNVERGDRWSARLFYRFIEKMSGFRAPDVLRTLVDAYAQVQPICPPPANSI